MSTTILHLIIRDGSPQNKKKIPHTHTHTHTYTHIHTNKHSLTDRKTHTLSLSDTHKHTQWWMYQEELTVEGILTFLKALQSKGGSVDIKRSSSTA